MRVVDEEIDLEQFVDIAVEKILKKIMSELGKSERMLAIVKAAADKAVQEAMERDVTTRHSLN